MQQTYDEILELLERWEATLAPDDYRARLSAAADAMEPGAPGRAELLERLSSDLLREAPARALELAQAAVEDGGRTTVDARVSVLEALAALGRQEQTDSVLRNLLRATSRPEVLVGLHARLGEALEMIDRHVDAQRAYTVGLRDFDPELDDPDMDQMLCLTGRYRARRARGLGYDSFDRVVEELSPEAAESIRERSGG